MTICRLRMICRKGSQSCAEIVKGTGIKRYIGAKTDALINYGSSGQRLMNFYKRFPSAKRVPTINKFVGYSKYKVVQIAEKSNILIPESRLELGESTNLDQWIEKRFNSQSGYGICRARRRGRISGKYYQRFINDRISELRVHGFRWIAPEDWKVQRRHGEKGEIAWNFNKGGHFSSIRTPAAHRDCRKAINITETILELLNMAFGACDFVIGANGDVWFIEINSCPGFQELSKGLYIDAFDRLKDMSVRNVLEYAN